MNWEKALQELISLVKATAPHLWEIVIRQVYVEVVQYIIFSIFFGAVFIFLFRLASVHWKIYKKDDSDIDSFMVSILSYGGFFGCIMVVLYNVSAAISRLINPEYYAIELLMNYVK